MPQVNDNQDRRGWQEIKPLTPEEIARDQGFQELVLGLLAKAVLVVIPVVLILGYVLYEGHEMPPWSMRDNQPADSTGYNPPATQQFAAAGIVPRTGLPHAFADRPDGSVPPAATKAKSPFDGGPREVARGKQVYADNCSFCHGANGIGDGPAGESYIPRPPVLTTAKVQSLSEGVMYYQITNGILSTPIPEARKYLPREWHAFRGTISERDRWAAVTFVKSLGTNATNIMAAPPGAPAGQNPASLATMPPQGQTF